MLVVLLEMRIERLAARLGKLVAKLAGSTVTLAEKLAVWKLRLVGMLVGLLEKRFAMLGNIDLHHFEGLDRVFVVLVLQ